MHLVFKKKKQKKQQEKKTLLAKTGKPKLMDAELKLN